VILIEDVADGEASVADIFDQYHLMLPLLFLTILQALFVLLGLLILVLPGIYLGVAYLLAMPLMPASSGSQADLTQGVW
jgi:hypothetical protein